MSEKNKVNDLKDLKPKVDNDVSIYDVVEDDELMTTTDKVKDSLNELKPVEKVIDEKEIPQNEDELFGMEDDAEEVTYQYTERKLTEEESTAYQYDKKLTRIKPFTTKKVLADLNSNDEETSILTIRGTANAVLASLERLNKDFLAGSDEDKINEVSKWYSVVLDAVGKYALEKDQLFEATIRKGSCWVNMVDCGDEGEDRPTLRGLVSDTKGTTPTDKSDNAAIAITKTLSSLGLGAPNYVPLWHSGIWLKLRTPTAASFIRLDEVLTSEKVQYGAKTRGEIFNNESVVLRKYIIDFILEHVVWSSTGNINPDHLKSVIKILDYEHLMLAMAQTRYPEGYPLAQACTIDPTECNHIAEGLVDLREMVFVDKNKLTAKQKRLMKSLKRVMTENDLKEYQDEFKLTTKSSIVLSRDDNTGNMLIDTEEDSIDNGIIINLEIPSIEKDEEYGMSWVNDLINNAENLFKEKHSEEKRRQRMEHTALTSYFKTYGSWIKSIEIYENGNRSFELTTDEELDEVFDHLSSDSRWVKIFSERIRDFITKNIITVIGILNYECPNCGKKHETPEGSHYIVLPIDMLYTFFIQARSAIQRSILRTNM